MTTFYWILFGLLLLFLITKFITQKMWALKQTPHAETPDKFGLEFEEVRFPTDNNRQLYGWWIPAQRASEKASTLVLVHGWSRNLGRMLRYIQHLFPLNYNLLAFDARHHGSSDADDHASMYKFGRDIRAAVQYVSSRNIDTAKIGVVGLSIGGAGAVYAASLEPHIKAVATVGAPAHPVDIMTREFKNHHVPSVLIWIILKQIERRIGISYEAFAPVNTIAKSDASFFIIHGDEDKVVLPLQASKLHKAARDGNSQLWDIPGRAHSNCHHEPGFWEKLHDFFQMTLEQKDSKS